MTILMITIPVNCNRVRSGRSHQVVLLKPKMSEEKPFLSIDEEDDSESVPPSHSSIIQYRPRLIITLLVHISVLVAYTVVFIALLRRTKTIGSTSLNRTYSVLLPSICKS
jgi:hypothetical protein